MDAETELPLLAARLRLAGQLGIRREMVTGLRNAAKPMVPYLRGAAGVDLPQKGGLAEKVARQPITVSVRTGVNTAGVSIRAQYTRTNKGTWRHPVFGRDVWVSQSYGPATGWFDKTAKEHTPEAKAELEKVLVLIAAQVNGLGL
jgi:hypothetical protein